jgi:hypothetical protein
LDGRGDEMTLLAKRNSCGDRSLGAQSDREGNFTAGLRPVRRLAPFAHRAQQGALSRREEMCKQ